MIAIYNLEPKYKNIALEKIRMYYGHDCEDYFPLKHGQYEKIYCSGIFTHTSKEFVTSDMVCGGTGFNLTTILPEEIESMKPKINVGFTSRGCIRRCSFCVVPKKEGKIRITGNIYDFWDGKSKELKILDNNILAIPNHFKIICDQIQREKLKVDFNQGLDHRLLTHDICRTIKNTRMTEVRFAYDSIKNKKSVDKAIRILNDYNIKALWTVLVGYDEDFESDLNRINYINASGQRAFAMKHEKANNNRKYMQLCRWSNGHLWRNAMTFNEFIRRNKI